MRILDRLRRRSHPTHDKVLVTTVTTPDPTRPIECAMEDDQPAVKWVEYYWRSLERDSLVSGFTEEEVCEDHFQQLVNDEDVKMEAWGTL